MAQLNPQKISDAQQLGVSPYELVLSNWGNTGASADRNFGSLQYPPTVNQIISGSYPLMSINNLEQQVPVSLAGGAQFPPSVVGLAISPRSTVDRCIVQFGQPQGPEPQGAAGALSSATQFLLTAQTPLVGRFNGPFVVFAENSTLYNDTYYEAGVAGSIQPFGGALLDPSTGLNPFAAPELRLLVYTEAEILQPPTARAVYRDTTTGSVDAAGTDILMRVIPVGGRKHVRTSVYLTGGTATAVTIALSGVQRMQIDYMREIPLMTSAALKATTNDATMLDLPTNPGVTFLLMKIASTDGSVLYDLVTEAYD